MYEFDTGSEFIEKKESKMGVWHEKKLEKLGERIGALVLESIGEGTCYAVRCDCGSLSEMRRDQIVKFNWTDCGCRGVKAGDKRGTFTVVSQLGTATRTSRARFVVECTCGTTEIVSAASWVRGENPHNCWASAGMVGKSFGRLTVVSYAGTSDSRDRRWNCSCVCGNVASAYTVDLNRGNVRSCGCLQREVAAARAKAGYPRTETPGYVTAHRWIWDTKGKASEHECVQCGAEGQDWAYDGEDPMEVVAQFTHKGLAYSLNPDHYQPMCKPCHGAFDAEMKRNRNAGIEVNA